MTYPIDLYAKELVFNFQTLPVAAVTTAGSGTYGSFFSGADPPSGGRTCDMTTDGAFPFRVSATNTHRIALLQTRSTPGNLIFFDRLCDVSGLVANVTTAQTVTMPALPRYSGGYLVEGFLEVYATFTGSTASNLTVNYTNELGAAKSSVLALTGTAGSPIRRVYPLPLADGDYGMRSIESVQFSNAYTSAGNIGFTLARRLHFLPAVTSSITATLPPPNETGAFRGGLPKILPNACMWLVGISGTTTVGGTMLSCSVLTTQ